MKSIVLMAALLAGTSAFAQTSTGDASMGANWSATSRSVFFGDDNTSMRTSEEAKTRWGSLSQSDKDAIMNDCKTFQASASGSSGSDTSATSTSGSTDTSTSGSTSGSDTSASGSSTSTDASGSAGMAITADNMKSICDMVTSF